MSVPVFRQIFPGNLIVSLDPRFQHQGILIVIRKIPVVHKHFKKLMVMDVRDELVVFVFFISDPDRGMVIRIKQDAAGFFCQKHQFLRVCGRLGQCNDQGMRQDVQKGFFVFDACWFVSLKRFKVLKQRAGGGF